MRRRWVLATAILKVRPMVPMAAVQATQERSAERTEPKPRRLRGLRRLAWVEFVLMEVVLAQAGP